MKVYIPAKFLCVSIILRTFAAIFNKKRLKLQGVHEKKGVNMRNFILKIFPSEIKMLQNSRQKP